MLCLPNLTSSRIPNRFYHRLFAASLSIREKAMLHTWLNCIIFWFVDTLHFSQIYKFITFYFFVYFSILLNLIILKTRFSFFTAFFYIQFHSYAIVMLCYAFPFTFLDIIRTLSTFFCFRFRMFHVVPIRNFFHTRIKCSISST